MRYLKLMRGHCPESVQIKAAGGVRTLDDFLRVGATATREILEEEEKRGIGEDWAGVKVQKLPEETSSVGY